MIKALAGGEPIYSDVGHLIGVQDPDTIDYLVAAKALSKPLHQPMHDVKAEALAITLAGVFALSIVSLMDTFLGS